MSSINTRTTTPAQRTHEGAIAARISPLQELIRSTMACMLWEDGFYEDGQTIADRITGLVHKVSLTEAAGVAHEARNLMKLRHVPLLIVRAMANHPKLATNPRIVSETLEAVIQRPDELTEFMAIYWKDGKQPLSKQVKLGLGNAFGKFNEYSLAKYNRKKDIKLRDVLFLSHAKPHDVEDDMVHWDKNARAAHKATAGVYPQARFYQQIRPHGPTEGELLFGKLVYDQLAIPDTWETQLSAGANKRETFERLMAENKLGDLAFLRNLRNMFDAGIQRETIIAYGDKRKWDRVLPFRFVAAARIVPVMEGALERWMFKCLECAEKMYGRTALLIDVSGSMNAGISAKSDLNRLDAAKALAMLLREVCEDVDVYTFNDRTSYVPARRGFALGDAIGSPRGGTNHAQAVNYANNREKYDRMIILTDEQSYTELPRAQNQKSYVINVAAYKNGIGYKSWMHIDGWSEHIIDYIQQYEGNLK